MCLNFCGKKEMRILSGYLIANSSLKKCLKLAANVIWLKRLTRYYANGGKMEFNSFQCLSIHHECNFTSKGIWLTFGPVKMKVKNVCTNQCMSASARPEQLYYFFPKIQKSGVESWEFKCEQTEIKKFRRRFLRTGGCMWGYVSWRIVPAWSSSWIGWSWSSQTPAAIFLGSPDKIRYSDIF